MQIDRPLKTFIVTVSVLGPMDAVTDVLRRLSLA